MNQFTRAAQAREDLTRTSRTGRSAVGLLLWLAIVTNTVSLAAWSLMLTVGNVHHWWSAIPPLAWWRALDIAVAASPLVLAAAILHWAFTGGWRRDARGGGR